MVLILWVWILHQGTMDVFSCWRMLRWFCRFGIRVLWWSAWASSGMGDGAAGSRVTVRVRLGLVLVLILLSYSTCPHFVYDMPSEHQFFGDWWHIDWYFVWFLFLIFCKTCNFFTGVKINFVYCFFFPFGTQVPNFVRCICEENELLSDTKIYQIRHNGSFLVIFWFLWGEGCHLGFYD